MSHLPNSSTQFDGLDEYLEPFSLANEKRNLVDWRLLCEKALIDHTPVLTEWFKKQAGSIWLSRQARRPSDQGVDESPQSKTSKSKEIGVHDANFTEGVLTVLYTWGVEYVLWQSDEYRDIGYSTNGRRTLCERFLSKCYLVGNDRGIRQNWLEMRSGKTVVILSQDLAARSGARIIFEWFHWACEVEMLRRIGQNSATGVTSTNNVPSIEQLAILRLLCKSGESDNMESLKTAIKDTAIEEAAKPILTDIYLSETLHKWLYPYLLRCAWAENAKKSCRNQKV